jgi:hypothetical protein
MDEQNMKEFVLFEENGKKSVSSDSNFTQYW